MIFVSVSVSHIYLTASLPCLSGMLRATSSAPDGQNRGNLHFLSLLHGVRKVFNYQWLSMRWLKGWNNMTRDSGHRVLLLLLSLSHYYCDLSLYLNDRNVPSSGPVLQREGDDKVKETPAIDGQVPNYQTTNLL